jgi:site-specific recombinase XerD
MGRERTTSGEGLPQNLYRKYQNNGWYFQYRDPRTGKYHGLGYDRPLAIAQATQLNALIAEQQRTDRVTAIYQPKPIITKARWDLKTALNTYHDITDKDESAKKIEKNTAKTRRSHINALRKLPNWELDPANLETMIADTAAFLESYREEGKDRTAQSLRSTLKGVFVELRQLGQWLHPLDPASATKNQQAPVKRARLTLDNVNEILDYIRHPKFTDVRVDPWLEHAILLAVTSSHCNAELCRLTYTDMGTGCWIEGDFMYITRQKVKNSRVCIPLDFGLQKIGYSLREIIDMTRLDKLKATHAIHHQRTTTKAMAGEAVHPNTYSRRFANVRDAVGIIPPEGKDPTTFYELRSLSQRLARTQGVDVKTLLGHKHMDTTDIYDDPRGGFVELKL